MNTETVGRSIWAAVGSFVIYRSIENLVFKYAINSGDEGKQRLFDSLELYLVGLSTRPSWIGYATLVIGLYMLLAAAFSPRKE